MTASDDGARPTKRKRVATRAQLIEAAAQLFAEAGTTAVSVEAICRRAGFTRGAFYSNFTTVDDVFFALHQRQTAQIEHRLKVLMTERGSAPDSLEAGIAHVLSALPDDGQWFALRAGVTGQALHKPELAVALREHADHLQLHLQPLLITSVVGAGRRLLTDPATFTRAVIAAHVGAVIQSLPYESPADDAETGSAETDGAETDGADSPGIDSLREAAVRGVMFGLTAEL
ncbi:TetR/AcrR family transcriptional regulator [Amycolatopsis sp. NBC_00345]|uniref:TetR/AcrR family transcriptional regulator n=1 Tax=Amycolatopsis sp. NBC_00345 TaxID=2975955 RepID=UPI002E26A887